MAIEYKPPNSAPLNGRVLPSIFLAGSIEMGKAELWQDKVVAALADKEVVLYNPRRDDWDSSWVQEYSNPQFKEQVDWELDNITNADIVIFYFDPNTMSPISLMELGLVLGAEQDTVIVCCPPGYARRGNVEIMCRRFVAPFFNSLDDMLEYLRKIIP